MGRLGGVVVSVLATGPKVLGFEPSQGDGFLRVRKVYKVLVRKHKGKRQLGRQRHRWEDGIRMDLGETGSGMEWI
jgi:hypothetical protein